MIRKACCAIIAAICLIVMVSCTSGDHIGSGGEAIAAVSGTPQSQAIRGAFAAPLVATVTQSGVPASSVFVTFRAPSTGATGVFAISGTDSITIMTDATGLATSGVFIANGTAGAYKVTASAQGTPSETSFSLTNTTGPTAILATGGSVQSAGINSTFAEPLTVKVVDGSQHPIAMAIVVFTAPATGASGKFADTGTNTTSATTDASGVATSAAFTANAIAGADIVTATVAGVSTPATFNLTNLAGSPATIMVVSGTPQRAAINTPFAAPLEVTVLDSKSNPVSGAAVTFSAPTSSASGLFANAMTTETDTTNASGVATSTVFTANGTTGGPYTVTAAVAGVPTAVDFTLTNTLPFKTYVFYLSGEEFNTAGFYGLAGAVQIDTAGNVLGGEQDYNDGGLGTGSPEPSGDLITTGNLTVNATSGQGTLTLVTNNSNLGVGGTETLGVQFVNLSHALIVQFDDSATSSGTMDVQTLPAMLSGGYAFTLTGVDPFLSPVDFGGVFTISGGTSLQNGVLDTNDYGTGNPPTTNASLSGTLSAFDSFGRGTITSTLNYTLLVGSTSPVALNYYVVGPEVLRIIDVDSVNNPAAVSFDFFDTAIGSAFGQGVNATTAGPASLSNSIFGMGSALGEFATVGMLSTTPASTSFSMVADDNELLYGVLLTPALPPISGTYSIALNGYGSLTIPLGQLGDVSLLGIYLTDPKLNLSDPNNTNPAGLGGALVADMDGPYTLAGGTGFLVPQTDPTSAHFQGKYAFGGQAFANINNFAEFDFVGGGTISATLAFSGTGVLNDPFQTFAHHQTNSGVKFSGTPLADTTDPVSGRYTLSSANSNPLKITIKGTRTPFDVAIYQASGGLLLWMDEDYTGTSVFLGSLQQKGSLTGLPGLQVAETDVKLKPVSRPSSAALH